MATIAEFIIYSQHIVIRNTPYDGPPVADEDILAITVVVQESLGLSTGKLMALVFQAALVAAEHCNPLIWESWRQQGSRTVVRRAETDNIWQRLLSEAAGVVLVDEGLTENSATETIFVSWPHRRAETPKILGHKRIPLWRDTVRAL